MKQRGILKYRADIRSVLTVVSVLTVSLVPFFLEVPLWLLLPYSALILYVHGYVPYIQHNHGHLPVFKYRTFNWIYDVLLAQCTGYPTAFWELQHVRGHHRHFLTPELDVAAIYDRKTGLLMSRFWYSFRGNLTVLRDSVRIGINERRDGRKSLIPKLYVELAIQLAITAALLYWNPLKALLLFVLPCLSMSWGIWWESYQHHFGLDMNNIYDASVTITDPDFNHLTFNIGHHAAHHEKPTLHWSLLPQRTEAIRDKLPAECIQDKYRFFAQVPKRQAQSACVPMEN